MRYRNILVPLVCLVGGFTAGWFAHRTFREDKMAAALKKQSDMYKEMIRDACTAARAEGETEGIEEERTRAAEEQVKKDREIYENLRPGHFTAEEYRNMFKPTPAEALDPEGKEEADIRVTMKGHGDPLDDILYNSEDDPDGENYIPEEPDIIDLNCDQPILYIKPEEVGRAFGYQEVDLKVFADGIVTDDIWNIIPTDEAKDLLGEDFMSHMGEFEDEAFWAMNRRNHTYYEVLLDPRTYREAIGRG